MESLLKEEIKLYYHDVNMPALQQHGDWIDLYIKDVISIIDVMGKDVTKDRQRLLANNELCKLNFGDTVFFDLGITVVLPQGYEAYILPRSSTFKNTGLLLTNGMGIIDEAYCGKKDVWKAMCYHTKQQSGSTSIKKYDRLFQFRINKKQSVSLAWISDDELPQKSRGGYGSSGK